MIEITKTEFKLAKEIKEYLNNNYLFFNVEDYIWEQRIDEEIYLIDDIQVYKTLLNYIFEKLEIYEDFALKNLYETIIVLSYSEPKLFI